VTTFGLVTKGNIIKIPNLKPSLKLNFTVK